MGYQLPLTEFLNTTWPSAMGSENEEKAKVRRFLSLLSYSTSKRRDCAPSLFFFFMSINCNTLGLAPSV